VGETPKATDDDFSWSGRQVSPVKEEDVGEIEIAPVSEEAFDERSHWVWLLGFDPEVLVHVVYHILPEDVQGMVLRSNFYLSPGGISS